MPPVMAARSVRRLLAFALLIGAVVCVAVAFAGSTSPAGATRHSLVTPLWSPRRLPEAVADAVRLQVDDAAKGRLQAGLDADAARYGSACFVVSTGATVLASRNATTPLIPASTQKLLTAAAALTRLGPGFRYTTQVVSTDPPGAGTVGQLWLVGSGDPVLRTADRMDRGVSTPLDTLADQIVARGIRRVDAIVGDDSRYDAQRFVPTWKPSYRSDFDVSPLGALTVNQSTDLTTGRPVAMDDPALYAASELTGLLRSRGVTVVGGPGHATAPPGATTIASVTSQPLEKILPWMFATSDNLTAELITKELGLLVNGEGTTTAGVAAIRATLTGLGVALDGQTMIDGSGLDRGNRLTCSILRAVVALGSRRGLAALDAALPVLPGPSAGRVHAKGGYLTDVTGLAGIATGADNWQFAFLANGGVPTTAVMDLTQFAATLAALQPPPRPDTVVPPPTSDAAPSPVSRGRGG
jgi:D-alanyl-D-alanine carboxypeptidase/D-alanyl-D-alanine-endopeptidase (penicillin-binding protein 4)